MQITSPFGYGQIVPLERHHKVLLPNLPASGGGPVPAFVAAMNSVTVSFSEIPIAARDYPIVFVPMPQGGYSLGAVLGLADNRNLFVEQGGWTAGAYVPAFIRRHPFCLSTVNIDGVVQAEKLVCIDSAYVDPSGVPLFDAAGAPTPLLTDRHRLLVNYENDLEAASQMCAGLEKLDLLEGFTTQSNPEAPAQWRMQGMFRVSEEKFTKLKAASHKALVEKGWAARIYAHLFSLDNFVRLHERTQRYEAALQKARKESFQR